MNKHNNSNPLSRRQFIRQGGLSLGAVALTSLLPGANCNAADSEVDRPVGLHLPPRAKNVIWLTMAGGPSQLDLFDPKPLLKKHQGKPIPSDVIAGEKFAQLNESMTLLGSPYRFQRHGESGALFSELLPNLASQADRLAILRSLETDSFNHDPAQLLLNTGFAQPGRPSMGAWIDYGLGSQCEDLPAFLVMISGEGQPLGAHSWSSGFLPSKYQGVQLRSHGEPVLFLSDPVWMSRRSRRRSLDALRGLNQLELERTGSREIEARISAYEMAFRMQSSVPELTEMSDETPATLDSYGAEPGQPSFANNCLLARRLVERGVRFIQLYHRGWDHHGLKDTGGIDVGLPERCREVDRASAALIADLDQRGLLESTLVIWGGEFGRTPIRQLSDESKYLGRDHHRRAFTMLLAGGGTRPGITHGATDELGYFPVEQPVHVHDLQATILHCLGIDHTRLTYSHLGREFRLTDVDGRVVHDLLA